VTIIKKILKYALNIGLILVITLFTLNLIFKDQELSEIISDLRSADPLWITIGAAAAVLFVSGESSIIHYMLRVLDQKTSFLRCLKYSFIGFFFSYITPSSTGGQPMQMYHMKKDKIKIGYSTLIMLLITIAYKSVLVLLALGFLIFNFDTVALYAGDMKWLIVLGFTLNLSFIILLLLVFLKPIWARALGIKTVDLLTKLHIMKRRNKEKYTEKLNIQYLTKKNGGPGPARNYGVEHSKGEYVLILDSDCVLPKGYLTAIEKELTENPCDAFGGPDAAHESFTNVQKAISYSMTSFFT
jgi:uncharacterized protein (TIRG00374 family)